MDKIYQARQGKFTGQELMELSAKHPTLVELSLNVDGMPYGWTVRQCQGSTLTHLNLDGSYKYTY